MTLSKFNPAAPGRGDVAQAGKPALRAFSLIEVLIAVTLMSVIIIGLMAMFGETQRAFRTGLAQVDVMEGGRSALELMAREVEQARPTGLSNYANFYVNQNFSLPRYELVQNLPGATGSRSNVLQQILFTAREGQEWAGIAYLIYYTNWIGTLYRCETNLSQLDLSGSPQLLNTVLSARPSKVLDGVVNLRVTVFDSFGRGIDSAYNNRYPATPLNYDLVDPRLPVHADNVVNCVFFSNALPAYVEIELGILESKTADKARAMCEDPLDAAQLNSQRLFLQKQAGKVQVFRQRIPIRNVDPSVYQ
jgi:Tfp pilus assembly protein PilV